MRERFIIIQWPEIQDFMDEDFFEEHSYLINDTKGMEEYGSSAYFVEEDWYNKIMRLKYGKREYNKQ